MNNDTMTFDLGLSKIDYSDLRSLRFRCNRCISKEEFLERLFYSLPKSVSRRMKIKLEPDGQKSGKSEIIKGDDYFVFKVASVTDYEIVLAGKIKILSIRIAVALINSIDNEYIGVVSSKIRFENMGGKIYFLFIKPFYRRIITLSCLKTENHFNTIQN